MAVHMNNIMMPSMVFVVMSIMLSSVLNATKHFIAAQLTGFALSVSMIVSTVWLSPVLGVDALAWGVAGAGILQVLILIPALRKDFRYSFQSSSPKDARFKKMLTLGVPALLVDGRHRDEPHGGPDDRLRAQHRRRLLDGLCLPADHVHHWRDRCAHHHDHVL